MSKRQSIEFPGFSHANPIPGASRIGNIMMSSVIAGRDPASNEMPAELDQQIVNIFSHVRSAVETAGGSPDDILKITFWIRDPATGRGALNGEWEKMFPDENSRPARHTQTLTEAGPSQVKCDFVAVLS
ncbi:MAG: RidA family protein [Rhodospirillaceae bacterium]|jgi:2-iminobutanoate/2-iminopropanoate deaminase|nr:RidA family protein [Rhodospirillaceae bacterium]